MPLPPAKTKGSTITSASPDASNSNSVPLPTAKTKGSTITSASPDALNSKSVPLPTAKTKGSTITSASPDALNSKSVPLTTARTKGSNNTSVSPDASNSNTIPLTTARMKGSNNTSTYLDASNPNSRTRRSVGSIRGSAAASPLLNLSAIRKAHRPRGNERSPSSVLPKRRDSSIGATSTNPKLRRGSVFETATPVKTNAPVDFSTSEGQAAMKKLRVLFAPVLMHAILRRRLRRKATKNPTRKYTPEAIVSAIRASKSLLADWPMTILHSLALEATYLFPEKQETIVYYNEPHLSCGMVVLLHGQLLEKRTKAVDSKHLSATKVADRPIRSQRVRTRYAPDVLCVLPVLCEDRSLTSLSTGPTSPADIAIIPSRAFWGVYNRFVIQSPEAETVTDSFRDRVIPQRTEMLLSSYYPTSVALQRSWCWEFFSSSDRVKLARMMEVRVLGIGDILVEEGVFSPYLYVVRRGTLTTVVKGEPLALVEPGMAFGEESILFNDPRNCTIIAGTVCELYALHVRALHHRFDKYPELAQRVIVKALERRSRWMEAGRTRNIFGLVSVLSSVPCLSHTTDAMREAIAECAQVLTTPAGFRLVTRNTPCQSLYVIGRGAVRVGGQVDAARSYFCVPGVGEAVSAGDFFGELCLRPHLWPTDVVSESSVDLWVIPRTELLEVLEGFLADAQAHEVCRQGIALYQAQNGKTSITEGFEPPSALPRDSRAPRPATPNRRPLSGTGTRDSLGVTSGRKSRDLSATLLKNFEWTEYAKVRREELRDDLESHIAPRELREADKEIEKAMMPRVRDLISVTVDVLPGPADSDLPGEVTELQAIIVEQLLLTPSAEQPRFLRQINHSNVKLVTEEANSDHSTPDPHEEVVASTEDLSGKDTIYSLGVPPELEQILSDDVETPAATEEPDSLSFESTAGGSLFGRSRRSTDESFSGLFTGSQQLGRISFANLRSHHLVRPQSGMPTTPRAAANAGSVNNLHDHIFSSRSSIMPPLSSEQKSVSLSAQRIRPASVDYAQQAKKNTERSDSMLNHYIKIENQNYFSNFVKVQPLEPEEVWLGGEDNNRAGSILVLMHVKGCNYLLPEVMEGCQQPFVKIFTGSRELARTPVMKNRVHPVWAIEESSFVGFIRRGEDISCVICDATNENRVVYQCAMSTTSVRAGGGVGEIHLVLHCTTSHPSKEEVPDHHARLSITLMVVTASNYKALHDQLLAESDGEDEESDETSEHEENKAYIQVLGVEGLKHRIEASVTVTIEEDGTTRNVLEAPPVLPKTRSPSWPAKVSFARLRGDGYVTLSVLQKGVRIGACETTVGDFVYGGTGVRRLPLRSDGNEAIGELLVYVLGTATPTATEAMHTESALFFSVERFTAQAEVLQIVPDPFVVVRNPDGEETLRTPLAFSTYSAAWDPATASCLLPCPVLPGCGDVYTLTVFDNSDKSASLGEATFTVAHDGLGPHTRYDIPLVNGKGTVRVEAHCLPIQRLSSSSVFDKVPNATHFSAMDPLVLVHVVGCAQLPGWEDEAAMVVDGGKPFLLTDSIATLAIGKQQYLRTPDQSSCNPQWPVSVASALLRVRPEETHETALFEVYDGFEDEEDKIGEVQARLVDLCCTGKHCLTLHAPRTTKGHHDSSRSSDAKDGIGSLVLSTYVVQLGAQVAPPGKLYIFPEDHRSVTTAAASELADANAEDNRASSRYVQIALTNLCNLSQLLVDTGSLVQVTVSLAAQQKVLLRTTRVILPQEVLAFDAAEGTSTVDLQNLSGEALRAEVTVVSQQVLASISGDTTPTMPVAPLLMLEGDVPWETLSTTGSEDVHVFTVSLTNTTDSKEVRAGRPPSAPMAVARKASTNSRTATDLGTAKLATLSMGLMRLKSIAAVN